MRAHYVCHAGMTRFYLLCLGIIIHIGLGPIYSHSRPTFPEPRHKPLETKKLSSQAWRIRTIRFGRERKSSTPYVAWEYFSYGHARGLPLGRRAAPNKN